VRILIKLGGTLLDDAASKNRLAAEISQTVESGIEVVVVHGGGKQMTRFLAEHGIESRFINGLRVTTPEVLDAVLKVLAGSVNRELVAALVAAGANAVGLTGMDALLTEAEPLSAELGAVGKPVRSKGRLIDVLLSNGYLPVVACLAGDREGRFYNVNADQMAVSVAVSIQADKLFFLTDVEGVRGKEGTTLTQMSLSNCQDLIDTGVATGGMRAKLDSASEAVRLGVADVRIAPGATTDVIRQLLNDAPLGTRLQQESGAIHG